MRVERRYRCPAVTAGVLVLALSGGAARGQQFLVPIPEIVKPPWNAQDIFRQTPLPILTDPDQTPQPEPEDTPVKGRIHPEYSPVGIRQGPWMFYPTVGAGPVYDSNVFSSSSACRPNQCPGVQDDFVTRFNTSLRGESLWDRHYWDFNFTTQSLFYAHHPGLNETNVDLKSRGRIDVDHATQILLNFEAAYLHDEVGSLSSPASAVEPTPYGLVSGDVTLRKQFGRLTASVGSSIDSYDFGSTLAFNGSTIDNSARDGQIYKVHERVEYAISEKSALFASFENNWRDLRGSPGSPLSSSGYRTLAGINIELTHLIKGEFAAGYQSQDFVSPLIGTIQGLAYRAFLTWSPTRRIDVYFNAEQVVTETSQTSSTGVLANAMQAGVDYEIHPSLVASAAAVYERDNFKVTPLTPTPRADNVYGAELRLKKALSNFASVSTFYRYYRRDSNIPLSTYDRHMIGLTASALF